MLLTLTSTVVVSHVSNSNEYLLKLLTPKVFSYAVNPNWYIAMLRSLSGTFSSFLENGLKQNVAFNIQL